LKNWAKIEQKLNLLLEGILAFLSAIVRRQTPPALERGIKKSKERFHQSRQKILKNAKRSRSIMIDKAKLAKDGIDKVKSDSALLVIKAKQIDYRELPIKKTLLALIAFIAPTFMRFKTWVITLKPATIVGAISLSSVATLSSLTIYSQSQALAEKARRQEEVAMREIASVRPDYYKRDERAFEVSEVVLPAYVESHGSMQTIILDFVFVPSNKYIKAYFNKNSFMVLDRLNTKVEPMAINFPLQEEGKQIIREKVKKEMNALLKELHIEGEIEAVHIENVIGS
jgi:hypothetical protein